MRQTKLLKYLWEKRENAAIIGCLFYLLLMYIDYLIECKYPTRFQWIVGLASWLWSIFVFWVIEPKPVYKQKQEA